MSTKPPRTAAIVCALSSELEGVLRVLRDQCPASVEEKTFETLLYFETTFPDKDGRDINLILTTPNDAGGQRIASHLHQLLKYFQIHFVLMTGICAGRREKVELGDIIVAKSAIDISAGKATNDGLLRSITMYQIDATLPPMVARLNEPDTLSELLSSVPSQYSKRHKQDALLDLVRKSQHGIKFRDAERKLQCVCGGDFKKIFDTLKDDWIETKDLKLYLKETKLQEILQKEAVGDFPHTDGKKRGYLAPYAVSPNSVVGNLNDLKWTELSEDIAQRDTLALEMESHAVYQTVHDYNSRVSDAPHIKVLVVKGVVDFADGDKDDSFHDYAAEVSGLWAYTFLRRYLFSATSYSRLDSMEKWTSIANRLSDISKAAHGRLTGPDWRDKVKHISMKSYTESKQPVDMSPFGSFMANNQLEGVDYFALGEAITILHEDDGDMTCVEPSNY